MSSESEPPSELNISGLNSFPGVSIISNITLLQPMDIQHSFPISFLHHNSQPRCTVQLSRESAVHTTFGEQPAVRFTSDVHSVQSQSKVNAGGSVAQSQGEFRTTTTPLNTSQFHQFPVQFQSAGSSQSHSAVQSLSDEPSQSQFAVQSSASCLLPGSPVLDSVQRQAGQSDQSEDEDLHVCGSCKTEFRKYAEFRAHKTTCSKRKKTTNVMSEPPVQILNVSSQVDLGVRVPGSPGLTQEESTQQVGF